MKWRAETVNLEVGARDPKREPVYRATDPWGCEWMVSLHDGGPTWNYTRHDESNEVIDCGTDFETPVAAMQRCDEIVREFSGNDAA